MCGWHIHHDILEAVVTAALQLYKGFLVWERAAEQSRKYALMKCTDGSLKESGLLGSNRPSVSCRYCNSALFTWLFTPYRMAFSVALFACCRQIFGVFNFSWSSYPQKFVCPQYSTWKDCAHCLTNCLITLLSSFLQCRHVSLYISFVPFNRMTCFALCLAMTQHGVLVVHMFVLRLAVTPTLGRLSHWFEL